MQVTTVFSVVVFDLFFATVSGAKAPQSAASEHRMVMQDRAILHANLMNTAGMCRDPRPVIIYPQASNNKIYYPRGTVSLLTIYFILKKLIKHFFDTSCFTDAQIKLGAAKIQAKFADQII